MREDERAAAQAEQDRLSGHLAGGSASDRLAAGAEEDRKGFFGSEGFLANAGKNLKEAAIDFGINQIVSLTALAGGLSNEADPEKVKLEEENVAAAKDKLARANTEAGRISAQHELDRAQKRLEREQGGQFNAALGEKLDAGKAFVENLIKNMPTLFKMLGQELPNIANDWLNALIDGLPAILDSFAAAAGSMVGKLIALIVPKIPDLAIAVVKGVIDAFIGNMDKLIGAMAEGIMTAIIKLVEKFTGGGALGKFAEGDIGGGFEDLAHVGGPLNPLNWATGGIVPEIQGALQTFANGGIARSQIRAARAAGDTVASMLSPGEAVFQAQAWKRMQESVVQATERGSGGGAVNIALTLRGRGGYDAAFEKIIGQAFTAEARRQGASARTAREVAAPGFVNLPDVGDLVNES